MPEDGGLDEPRLLTNSASDRDTFTTQETQVTIVPIDIETFEEATDADLSEATNAEKVVRFLYRNDDKAFAPSEIAEGAGVKQNSISTVLRRLEGRDLVQHKGNYWAIGSEEQVRDAFDLHRILVDLEERLGEEDVDEWRESAVEAPDE